jgi:glutamine cyclotransferase
MARLLSSVGLGFFVLLGVASVSSCGTPLEANENNSPRYVVSAIPNDLPSVSPTQVGTARSTKDIPTETPSPSPTSPPDVSISETTTIPSTKDVSHTAISPTPPSSEGLATSQSAILPTEKDTPPAPISPLPSHPADTSEYEPVPTYTYRVVNTYAHDRGAFTQGLVVTEGILYEGTGRLGASSLRRVELETGDVLQLRRLPVQLFGEGVTVFDDKVYQLTWKAHIGFVYDKYSFDLLGYFTYPTQGWGLTHDGQRLIMSDGTSTLYFLDPDTFEETGQVQVHDNDGPVTRLNELEYVRGEIFANVWTTDRIARIDPQTGRVTGWIDLAGLLSEEDRSQPVDVLNGIAYDAENDRLFVTGKLWPKLFEIELVPEATLE